MYAPPAVELPNTSAMVGMPAADSRVRSRNIRPPGMKISFWVGRSAPPDSTSEMTGSRFSNAISLARRIFFSVHGLLVPPWTVGSLDDDQALDALDDADADHHAGADREVGAPRGERAQFEERRVGVEEQFDAFAGGQLAARVVPLDVLGAAAGERLGVLGVELGELGRHRLGGAAYASELVSSVDFSAVMTGTQSSWRPALVRISVVPPPIPRMRMSRYWRSTSDSPM